MTSFVPREGDTRPYRRDPSVRLQWSLNSEYPFRWLPRHGDPSCVVEWFSQRSIKALAYLPVYTAIIVTIVLIVQLFGIPFVGGGK